MEVVPDFQDILRALDKHRVRYLIIGGLAFIYHAKPRYTKDMDLWVDPSLDNIQRLNQALAEFGSPWLMDEPDDKPILQIGVAPNRIDIIAGIRGLEFESAWLKRIRGVYGDAPANWIDMDSLIRVKEKLKAARHKEDVRVLRKLKEKRERGGG